MNRKRVVRFGLRSEQNTACPVCLHSEHNQLVHSDLHSEQKTACSFWTVQWAETAWSFWSAQLTVNGLFIYSSAQWTVNNLSTFICTVNIKQLVYNYSPGNWTACSIWSEEWRVSNSLFILICTVNSFFTLTCALSFVFVVVLYVEYRLFKSIPCFNVIKLTHLIRTLIRIIDIDPWFWHFPFVLYSQAQHTCSG